MLLSFVIIVSFVIQRIICPNNPDVITKDELPSEHQNIKFEDVEINEFPFLVLVFVVWLDENNEEKCESATIAVLINENTILLNVDSTELLKELIKHKPFDQDKKTQYYFFQPDVYVIYGKSYFREYYQVDSTIRSIVCDCEKVKNDGVKLIRLVKYPTQLIPNESRYPFVCLGFLEKSVPQNGKNISYVDLYEGEEVLKGDLKYIAWYPPQRNNGINHFVNDDGYFNNIGKNYYCGKTSPSNPSFWKFKKITFPYLGCKKCKSHLISFGNRIFGRYKYQHPICYSERDDCVGHTYQYFNVTKDYINKEKNYFGSILMKKYVHPRTKKIKWKYYGIPTCILRVVELRFSKIIFRKISPYVNWILKTSSSSKPGNKILFVLVIIIVICLSVIFLFTISLLTIFFISKKKKKDRETGGRNNHDKKVKSESSTNIKTTKEEDQNVVDVMKTYTKVPEWMDEKKSI